MPFNPGLDGCQTQQGTASRVICALGHEGLRKRDRFDFQ
jgi:hypothetical protein